MEGVEVHTLDQVGVDLVEDVAVLDEVGLCVVVEAALLVGLAEGASQLSAARRLEVECDCRRRRNEVECDRRRLRLEVECDRLPRGPHIYGQA